LEVLNQETTMAKLPPFLSKTAPVGAIAKARGARDQSIEAARSARDARSPPPPGAKAARAARDTDIAAARMKRDMKRGRKG
jgi:hypothetical protein